MHEFLIALFLGVIEGLTEFIPVSSTAHLVVLVKGLNFPAPPGHVFEVFIQLGAIMAIIVLYRHKLWQTATRLPRDKTSQKLTLNVLLGCLPVLIVGALGHEIIKDYLYNTNVIAAALIAGGLVILFLDKKFNHQRITSIDDISPKTAFTIGLCQMTALIPGVSRSGATIMGGLASGLSRPVAAEFSFFLAIPVMLAAVLFDVIQSWDSLLHYEHPELMLVGLSSAFLSALAIVKLALYIINKYGFAPFGWYRIVAGITILAVFW
jgi:undecaprenyl-diphosphatase